MPVLYIRSSRTCPTPTERIHYIKKTGRGKKCTRASIRGDCVVPYRRTTFGQYVLSIKGSEIWNKLPVVIRECPTPSFKNQLK